LGGATATNITTAGVNVTGDVLGPAQILTTSSNININSSNTVVLTGGSVANSLATIATTQGNVTISTPANISLTGGSASGTGALIQSKTQGSITLSDLNFLVQGGTVTGSSGISTPSGDISVTCTQNCQTAATLLAAPAVIQTFGSDLTVIAGESITLSGFATYSTPAPTGNLLLIAGQNISIDSTSQVTANGTVSSSLTMVVDNLFPTSPGIGPGEFLLTAGGIVSAGAGTPVRIYTARRPQNTIGGPINGSAFVPGPFNVDSTTEEWSTYYAGGTYGGADFKIYYKDPGPSPQSAFPERFLVNAIAANLTQLTDLLPNLQGSHFRRFLEYHFKICDQDMSWQYCDPIFSPYGSFIFEDDLYWIGVNF
jgi:hypothetical protein